MIDENGFLHAPIRPLRHDEVEAARRVVAGWVAKRELGTSVGDELLSVMGIADPPEAIVEVVLADAA